MQVKSVKVQVRVKVGKAIKEGILYVVCHKDELLIDTISRESGIKRNDILNINILKVETLGDII